MKKLKIGIIGLGYWGNNFLRIINEFDKSFELTSVVDSNKDLLKKFANENVDIFDNVNNLLSSKTQIDCAIISTNTEYHYSITKLLLENGIHCLVEKPLTTSVDEANELYEISERNNIELFVDHTFLYDQSILELKKIIDEGELGKILHISFERTNLGPIRTDVNAAWDLSTHDLAILYSFLKSDPNEIAVSSKSFLNKDIQDIVNISLDFDDLFVTFFSSWLHPEKSRIIKVVGDKKMAVWNGLLPDEELKIFDKGVEINQTNDYSINIFKIKSGDVHIPFISKSEPLKNVVLDFYNRIVGENFNKINH